MKRGPYRRVLLSLLLLILAFNFIDRVALGVLLESIKHDLRLNDTELGLLSGIAFALFYSVMGIPIARWADRGNRSTIITITVALWSLAVIACGLVNTYTQLLLTRVFVAIGEAGCTPPAFSLLADYYNRSERPRAVAIYGLGVPLGIMIAFFSASWLNDQYGWQLTFVLIGAPGLALAVIARLLIREPRTASSEREKSHPVPSQDREEWGWKGLVDVSRLLWRIRTYRHLLVYFAIQSFFAYGILTWLPAFYSRTHGVSGGVSGIWLALTYGIGGIAGSYLGGEVASRYAASKEKLQLRAMAVAVGLSGALSISAYLASNPYCSFILVGLATAGLTVGNGALFATIQTLVPPQTRAVSIAILYLFANLLGMGLGPLSTGALSDLFSVWAGEESLRWALLVLGVGYFWAAREAWRSGDTVDEDLAATGSDDAPFAALVNK